MRSTPTLPGARGAAAPAGSAKALRSLLERRLLVVTGKGGTGKTTVAASLGLAAARAGLRVLVAEMGPDEQLPDLLAPGTGPVGYAGRQLSPGLRVQRIDPYAALEEYLSLQLGVRGPVSLVLRNRSFRQLMAAAPGWRDLITLGKIWHVEQMQDDAGRRRFDLIVVDAPATGHGLTFLDVPRVVVSAVRAGPLRRNAERVEAMVTDPEQTLLLPVALAEELPAKETAELVARLRASHGIAVDRVVVNGSFGPPFPPGLEELDQSLARLPEATPLGALPSPRTLAACAGYLRARHELNRRYTAEIVERTGLPTVCLPYLPGGTADRDALASLGQILLEPLGGEK